VVYFPVSIIFLNKQKWFLSLHRFSINAVLFKLHTPFWNINNLKSQIVTQVAFSNVEICDLKKLYQSYNRILKSQIVISRLFLHNFQFFLNNRQFPRCKFFYLLCNVSYMIRSCAATSTNNIYKTFLCPIF